MQQSLQNHLPAYQRDNADQHHAGQQIVMAMRADQLISQVRHQQAEEGQRPHQRGGKRHQQ